MPQTMLTVRGNLGANPDYLPEKTMEDGAILPYGDIVALSKIKLNTI